MADTFARHTLAQGKTLTPGSVRKALQVAEGKQPEKTRMELSLAWHELRLPLVGTIDLAAASARAVNAAYRLTHALTLWPGEVAPASHDSPARTTTIHWVKMAPGVGVVTKAIEAGAGDDAAAAVPAAALAIFAALAGVLIWQYLTHWRFAKVVAKDAEKVPHAIAGAGTLALAGIVVVGGVFVINELRRL